MHEDPPTPFDTVGDEPVEARIVAWVLGEASAFEAAELERLCEERPELLVFRRRMRALHGLLTEAEAAEPDNSWKLPAEKRRVLDEIFGDEKVVRLDPQKEKSIRHSARRALLAIAACLVLTLIVAGLFASGGGGIQRSRKISYSQRSEKAVEFIPQGGAGGSSEANRQALDNAVRDQEDKVEERRKVLATIARTKGITYKGQDSFYGQSGVDEDQGARKAAEVMKDDTREEAIKRGLDTQDYADAKREFESDQQFLQQLKLRQIEQVAASNLPEQSLAMNDGFAESKNRSAAPAQSAAPATPSESKFKVDSLAKSSTREPGLQETARQSQLARQPANRQVQAEGATSSPALPEPADAAEMESLPAIAADGFSNRFDQGAGLAGKESKVPQFQTAALDEVLTRPEEAPAIASKSELGASQRAPRPRVVPGGDSADSYGLRSDSLADMGRDQAASLFEKDPAWQLDAPSSQTANAEADSQDVRSQSRARVNLPGKKFQSSLEKSDLEAMKQLGWSGLESNLSPETADQYIQRNTIFNAGADLNLEKDEAPRAAGNARTFDDDLAATALNEKPGSRREQLEDSEQPANGSAAESASKLAARPPAEVQMKLADLMEEIPAAENPYSTFSLNISDASFQLAKAALAKGEGPDPASIKTEQFYNAVDYGDPAPSSDEPVAATVEQSAHPIIPGRNLVRVALRTGSVGRLAVQPLRLTLLVDQSGSMVREDRRASMEHALSQLGVLLTKADLVTVIGFSRTPHILAEVMTGDQSAKLSGLVNQTASEGGTNLEEAMKLGGQLAERHQLAGAQNRIVLFTDGAANLGDADPERLSEQVKSFRQKGLSFDIAGIGADGLNDRLLSELARKGNGRYYVVGSEKNDSFAKQLAGAFRPAAENVKVQVNFNPQRVGKYKLIGFEKDRLKTEDFRNDAVDAAELAAEEAGVAIYQVEPLAEGTGEIGEVSVRFRDAATKEMVERTWTISYDSQATAFDRATPSMQLAGLSLLAAEKLKGGPMADAIDFKQLTGPSAFVKQFYGGSPRVADMLRVIDALK